VGAVGAIDALAHRDAAARAAELLPGGRESCCGSFRAEDSGQGGIDLEQIRGDEFDRDRLDSGLDDCWRRRES